MVGVTGIVTCVSEHHKDSSNPTTSIGVDRCQTRRCKATVFWRLARLARLDFRCATRNATPQEQLIPNTGRAV
jgi:hypothetical protein